MPAGFEELEAEADEVLRLPVEEIVARPPKPSGGLAIGRSREERTVGAHRLGSGPLHVSLIGGCHADEPVGPETLARLAAYLEALPAGHLLVRQATWYIVPHANPDGERRNRAWTSRTVAVVDHRGAPDVGYELASYLAGVVRESPGDDMEFGFPRSAEDRGARPENLAIAEFLASGAPFALHASLHGMGLASGPWFLLEEAWTERTRSLRDDLRRAVADFGYTLFDPDRQGEKGFRRIDRGFSTRPDSGAMRRHFESAGEPETARRFRPSSMELVRRLGADPLTVVSEMPLFLLPLPETGNVELMSELGRRRSRLEAACRSSARLDAVAAELGVKPMPIRDQMRLQLLLLNASLACLPGTTSPAEETRPCG